MKYFKEEENKIVLGRVLSIKRNGLKIIFKEMCDKYYSVEMDREDAIKALREAEIWISGIEV